MNEIIKSENVALIINNAPTAYEENQLSHNRCLQAGGSLLKEVENNGMSDELDERISVYIERSRKTVKKMFDKRSPVTKLFDEIRQQFTGLEGDIDPTKKESIAYKLQQYRNIYASQKRKEAEERRRQLIAEQERNNAINKYTQDIEESYNNQYNRLLCTDTNVMLSKFSGVTLENYQDVKKFIEEYNPRLIFLSYSGPLPTNVDFDTLTNIRQSKQQELHDILSERFQKAIDSVRNDCLEKLPSKVAELERASQATAEEAKMIAEAIERKDNEDASRINAEMEAEAKIVENAVKLAQETAQANDLFNQASASMETYKAKTSVKQTIEILAPEGILPVISMWWNEEGCKMTVEELSKMFKKQITACERMANKFGQFVNDKNVVYNEEVKAK